MISPIANKENSVKLIDSFDVQGIISNYQMLGIKVDRFFEGLEKINLYECIESGYRFYHPFSAIGDAEFYKDLSINRKNYYSTRWEHLKIITTLKHTERVLEIGSGFGSFLKLLKSKSIYAEGIELNPEALKQCIKDNLVVHDELIEEFAKQHPNEYDVVCYFQVLEHITEVHSFIENSLIPLKTDGKLIIGVPNNNPYLFVNDKYHTLNLPPHHAGLWNLKSLKALEQIFPITIESVNYEPLAKTYNSFLKVYIDNSNYLYSKVLRFFKRVAPKYLKKVLCRCINGRNILVVFRKIADE